MPKDASPVARAQDLTIAKNDIAAETVAATIWQLTESTPNGSPVMASALRLVRRLATELVELHNLNPDEVTPKGGSETGDSFTGHEG
jgi:hypothetical protein